MTRLLLAGWMLDWPVQVELSSHAGDDGSGRWLRAMGLQALSRQHPACKVSLCIRDHMVLYFTANPVRYVSAASIHAREWVGSKTFAVACAQVSWSWLWLLKYVRWYCDHAGFLSCASWAVDEVGCQLTWTWEAPSSIFSSSLT